jgi:hypothetical protein
MMPLEKVIVGRIVKMAERHGWYAVKIHGGPMQKSGLPDLMMLKHGRAVFLEVKQPGSGKKSDPTPLQLRRMDELRSRGGCECHVVRSVEDAAAALRVVVSTMGFVRDDYRTATDTWPPRCERRAVRRTAAQ